MNAALKFLMGAAATVLIVAVVARVPGGPMVLGLQPFPKAK